MSKRKIFVLDTNVLLHDPSSLFRFEEHDLYVPMVVLEELDNSKKGTSETARNARQVSRFFDELMTGRNHAQIEKGLPLPAARSGNGHGNGRGHNGKPASRPQISQRRGPDAGAAGSKLRLGSSAGRFVWSLSIRA